MYENLESVANANGAASVGSRLVSWLEQSSLLSLGSSLSVFLQMARERAGKRAASQKYCIHATCFVRDCYYKYNCVPCKTCCVYYSKMWVPGFMCINSDKQKSPNPRYHWTYHVIEKCRTTPDMEKFVWTGLREGASSFVGNCTAPFTDCIELPPRATAKAKGDG